VQSMYKLLIQLLRAFGRPEDQAHQEDLFSIGRFLERDGEREAARRCFRAAGSGSLHELAAEARASLAKSYRKDRRYLESEAVYADMIARGEGGVQPYVERAKIAEHHTRDMPAALKHTEAAIYRLELRERLGGAADNETASALHLRRARLLRRIHCKSKESATWDGEPH